ncbi:MAG: hypothetical protein A2096_08715 [Spirochaetes bacterium GWF1_41_5]|nr:MAG: hypothetical protein A2096_08715 [Spirochaetes bacterium GWF1_41_5]HBE03994.1 hypothetical protein [Spirochaetia bacterium]
MVTIEEEVSALIPEIIGIIENKDIKTLHHASGVQRYGSLIMEKLGLDEEYVSLFYTAAIFHDLGKIFWPDEFLNQHINLSLEQFTDVMKHPDSATHFLQMAGVDPRIIQAVRHHHERYDGDMQCKHPGYPDGLKGEQIPFLARILAVADTYEALTSGRPYRDAIAKMTALAIIESEKGKQFDPIVVDALWAAIIDFEKKKQSDIVFLSEIDFYTGCRINAIPAV